MRLSLVLAAAALASQAACMTVSSGAGPALIGVYKEGGIATSVAAGGKRGEACAINVLSLVAVGDASIDTARQRAGITHVSTVDYDVLSILGIFGKRCTLVTGD